MKMWKKILGSFILTAILIVLSGCTDKIDIVLKNNEITVEYGDKLKEAKEYLDPEKMNEEDIDKVELDASSMKNEEGKDYPAVGEYTVTFNCEKETKEMKIKVQDTTVPIFKEFKDKLETEQGKKISDDTKKKSFIAEDLSDVIVKIDDSKVDYAKAGEYKMIVIAEDEYGNKTEKECTVKVKEKKKEETTVSKDTGTKSTASSSSSKGSSSSQSTGSSSSKPSGGSSSSSKPSEGSSSGTQASKPHQHVRIKDSSVDYADESKWFNTMDEADAWAYEWFDTNGVYASGTWSCVECSCGKYGVAFFNLEKWED